MALSLAQSAAVTQNAVTLDTAALPPGPVEALYVHIPFCFHKCHYCDFYSITRQTPLRMSAFVHRILAEAQLWARSATPARPRTIFFGGGTPTLLPAGEMARLIAGLRAQFDFSEVDEFTVEANPATVGHEMLAVLRDAGVGRLSFGAQSFHKPELAFLERHHDPADVPRSIEAARAAGFARLNVDLIYAIPGQTDASWQASLDAAIALGVEHISAYALTYESNTPLAVRKRMGQFTGTDDDTEIRMMRQARAALAASGYEAYEISNYARAGEACRHNVNYWTGGSYLALGPSGASHVRRTRWRNRPHLGEWETAVDAGQVPAAEVETLSQAQSARETAMLMLRLAGGIEFAPFAARTGMDAGRLFADPIARFSGVGLLQADAQGVRLTEAGLPVADALASEFLAV